jgi:hypothetical protein
LDGDRVTILPGDLVAALHDYAVIAPEPSILRSGQQVAVDTLAIVLGADAMFLFLFSSGGVGYSLRRDWLRL